MRQSSRHRNVEGGAALARILQKTPLRRMRVEDGEPAQDVLTIRPRKHPGIVGDE